MRAALRQQRLRRRAASKMTFPLQSGGFVASFVKYNSLRRACGSIFKGRFYMTFAKARIAMGMLAGSALVLAAASMSPAQAAKKTQEECMRLASQRGFSQVVTRAEAAAKKAFVVSCMQGKQG
jgi:hypothetical protein